MDGIRRVTSVRLILHPNVLADDQSAWSLALVSSTRNGPNALWLTSGHCYVPAPQPTEREAWEAILALSDWYGSASRY